ncbi:hypothetical protein AK830_g3548 [Neonectria ditissima]|uniref:Clr5 domain-containing protein n=1 Tax=Neonectria ditissima TaxID=78410 RepID=A0A0P7BQ56_9HYPO|nr:hypothetical protein AK830_g3548 [Neonectria ditissima]
MVSAGGAGDLTWVLSRNPRASALSNDDVDPYKEPIRQLYLVENLTCDQVRDRLLQQHGFSISYVPSSSFAAKFIRSSTDADKFRRDQFTRATSRWGFHKQPRKPRGALAAKSSAAKIKIVPVDPGPVWAPLEVNKRPRSTESTASLAEAHHQPLGPAWPSPDRPAKRCKPVDNPHSLEDATETATHLGSFGTTAPLEEHEGPERALAQPLINSSIDLSYESPGCNDPNPLEDSSVEANELRAEYLAACYLSRRAFGYFEKVSLSSKYSVCSTRDRRAMMLDLARTAKSPSTRDRARAILENELRASDNSRKQAGGEPMTPNEAFLFHRHLARMYSSEDKYESEVLQHLDQARRFTNSDGMPNPTQLPSLDLWTLRHILDGKDDRSISNDLFDMLKYDELNLSLVIQSCLKWCKERLQELLGMEALFNLTDGFGNIQTVGMSPVSMSRRRRQWDSLALWAYTSSVFAHLWENMQIKPPSSRDNTSWLNEGSLPDMSVTHFLMIICRMIVHESRFFTPFWNVAEGSPDAEDSDTPSDFSTIRTGPCLMVIEVLIAQCSDSPRGATRRFATQFCDHHSWAPPRKNTLILRVRTELLECLNSTIQATSHQRSTTPMPPIPRIATSAATDSQEADDSLSDLLDYPALQEVMKLSMSTLSISETDSRRNTMKSDPKRSSSIASGSTISFHTRRLYLKVVQGNPALARGMSRRSSYSSQVSGSSSL